MEREERLQRRERLVALAGRVRSAAALQCSPPLWSHPLPLARPFFPFFPFFPSAYVRVDRSCTAP